MSNEVFKIGCTDATIGHVHSDSEDSDHVCMHREKGDQQNKQLDDSERMEKMGINMISKSDLEKQNMKKYMKNSYRLPDLQLQAYIDSISQRSNDDNPLHPKSTMESYRKNTSNSQDRFDTYQKQWKSSIETLVKKYIV